MKKSLGTKMKVWAIGALAALSSGVFTSCTDEIPMESRFTFTGELIKDHLKKHDKYKKFCEILDKAKTGKSANSSSILTTLSTYGSYTCFAPTNEAIDRYLQMKYDEYLESVRIHEENPEIDIVNTGVTSPYIEDLSDSMATVIAKNHILELACPIANNGNLPKKTMNRRNIEITWAKDEDISYAEGIKIIDRNIETENGYIHSLSEVLSPSDKPTSALLGEQPAFSLFSEALEKTGFGAKLTAREINPDYSPDSYAVPPFITQNKQVPPAPAIQEYGFTLLVESNELLADETKNHLGISIQSIEDLEWFAANWYCHKDSIDADNRTFPHKGNYKNPNNPLYKFIAYHILDRTLQYNSGPSCGGFVMEGYEIKDPQTGNIATDKFNSEINLPKSWDRYDYFETHLPYTSVKVTKPFTNSSPYTKYGSEETGELKDELVINYAQDKGERIINPNMSHHINVVIENTATSELRTAPEKFKNQATNGRIFTIDKILVYNEEEMAGNVLNERMRWDVFSLFPELTTNDVRWLPEDNYTLVYIPQEYSARLRHRNSDTHVYYLRPHKGNWPAGYVNYQGDEMLVTGKYDFEYRIPYVPDGYYEIRFGFSTSDARGIAQFYFDGKICGIPLNMTNSADNVDFLGWFEESDNEDENRKNDKAMRNRGFMKAPASIYLPGPTEKDPAKSLRYATTALRRIIGTYHLKHGKDYWLRFKDVTEGGTADDPNEFNQDYLEIVPVGIINNPGKPEDIY